MVLVDLVSGSPQGRNPPSYLPLWLLVPPFSNGPRAAILRPAAVVLTVRARVIISGMISGESGASSGKDAQQSGGLLRDRHGEAHCMHVPGSTSRTRTQPGASSGRRDRSINYDTGPNGHCNVVEFFPDGVAGRYHPDTSGVGLLRIRGSDRTATCWKFVGAALVTSRHFPPLGQGLRTGPQRRRLRGNSSQGVAKPAGDCRRVTFPTFHPWLVSARPSTSISSSDTGDRTCELT